MCKTDHSGCRTNAAKGRWSHVVIQITLFTANLLYRQCQLGLMSSCWLNMFAMLKWDHHSRPWLRCFSCTGECKHRSSHINIFVVTVQKKFKSDVRQLHVSNLGLVRAWSHVMEKANSVRRCERTVNIYRDCKLADTVARHIHSAFW